MTVRVLVVGAHPDDIEIAVGGTVSKLVERGVDLVAVVASDETDPKIARIRRLEAKVGLGSLGVTEERTVFLGLPDRSIEATDSSSTLLRQRLADLRFEPDIVITHSTHDRHPDHRQIARIVRAATGDAPLNLGMAVVNSVAGTFAPDVFVDTSDHVQTKAEALAAYRSQDALGRIRWSQIEAFERSHAVEFGVDRVEPFELTRSLPSRGEQALACLERCFTSVAVDFCRTPR